MRCLSGPGHTGRRVPAKRLRGWYWFQSLQLACWLYDDRRCSLVAVVDRALTVAARSGFHTFLLKLVAAILHRQLPVGKEPVPSFRARWPDGGQPEPRARR